MSFACTTFCSFMMLNDQLHLSLCIYLIVCKLVSAMCSPFEKCLKLQYINSRFRMKKVYELSSHYNENIQEC